MSEQVRDEHRVGAAAQELVAMVAAGRVGRNGQPNGSVSVVG